MAASSLFESWGVLVGHCWFLGNWLCWSVYSVVNSIAAATMSWQLPITARLRVLEVRLFRRAGNESNNCASSTTYRRISLAASLI
jgi:hypothetical protein